MKQQLSHFIGASLFSLCLSSVSMATELSENFVADSDSALDVKFLVTDTAVDIDGNKYSIIGNSVADVNYKGLNKTNWKASTVDDVGDIDATSLDSVYESLNIKFDSETGALLSYDSEGFVGFAGALYFNGSVTINNSVFTDNVKSSTNDSSALYINNGDNTIKDSAFVGNSGGYAIVFDGGGYDTCKTLIENTTFIGNQSAIQAKYAAGGITVSESNFISNAANADTDNLINNTNKSVFNISDTNFENNTYKNLISNNSNQYNSSFLNITDSTFKGNTNDDNTSVALYLYSASGTVTDPDTSETSTVVYSAVTNIVGSTFEYGNSIINTAGDGNITITGSKFLNNSSANNYLIYNNGGSLVIEGSEFKDNASISTSTDYLIFTSDYLSIKDTTFENNSGYSYIVAGSLNNWNPATIYLDNVTFSNNSNGVDAYIDPDTGENIAATAGNSTALYVNTTSRTADGVTTINYSTADVKNSTFKDNDIAITLSSNSSITVDNTLFEGNGYVSAESGVLYAKWATNANVTLKNSIFDGNSSNAGIICSLYDSTEFYIENCEFKNNAGNYGGTINVANATVVDSTFINNTATSSGAAFYIVPDKVADIVIDIKAVNKDTKSYGNTSKGSGFILMATDEGETATVNFDIAKDRTMEIGNYTVASDEIKSYSMTDPGQTINKTGDGSLMINSSMAAYYGDLNINEGSMYINKGIGSSIINVSEGATTMIRLNTSTFSNSSSLTINNDGNIILSGAIGGSGTKWVYKDVSVSTYNDNGTTTVYGGTFNSSTGAYATSTAISVSDNSTISSAIAQNGIVRYTDSDSNILMELQLNSATELSISNIDIGSTALISAYYTINGLTLGDGDSALVSFLIDDITLSIADLNIYEFKDSEWVVIDDSLEYLQYDGQYLSFITDDLSNSIGWGYVTAVPEPSTYAAIAGALALGLAMYRRRK